MVWLLENEVFVLRSEYMSRLHYNINCVNA